MRQTYRIRTEGLPAVGARPCASMHGYAWQAKQGFGASISTGVTNAPHRIPGAPT